MYPTHSRRLAFTVLELLVVVVILGILAALMLVRFAGASEKAMVAVMQSDLKNFSTARALFMAEGAASPSAAADVPGFSFSDGVFETDYSDEGATQWALTVGHRQTDVTCVLSTLDSSTFQRIECAQGGSESDPNQPPTAELTFAPGSDLLAGTVVTFSVLSAEDPDGDELTYHWSFSDGRTATGPSYSRSFPGGSHSVTLTTRDPSGAEGTDTRSFEVLTTTTLFGPNVPDNLQGWGLWSGTSLAGDRQVSFSSNSSHVGRNDRSGVCDIAPMMGSCYPFSHEVRLITLSDTFEEHSVSASTPYGISLVYRIRVRASGDYVGKTINLILYSQGMEMSANFGPMAAIHGYPRGTAYGPGGALEVDEAELVLRRP